jgi:alpha-tubulin suppressor-like RCC1 family protein
MSHTRTKEQEEQEEQEKKDRDNAGGFRFQPKDVVDKMASFLDGENNATLRMTCRFFAKNQTLLNTVKSHQKIFALDNCTFILNGHGSLHGLGQIPSYLGGDETGRCIPITLPDSQPIAHIAHQRHMIHTRIGAGPHGCTVKKVSITIICTKDGTVYGAGDFNHYGQLGLGHQNKQKILTPIPIPGNKRIMDATLGGGTTILLADDGTVFGCGYNGSGNLGVGDTVDRVQLEVIPLPENNTRIKKVALGNNHTIMLTEDGKVYGCGSNDNSQLNGDVKSDQSTLTLISIPENKSIQQIAATDDCTILVATDGTVYGCGANHYNLLCLSNRTWSSVGIFKLQLISIPDNKPIQSVSGFNFGLLFLARDGTVYGSGNNSSQKFGIRVGYHDHEPTCISTLNSSNIRQIRVGFNHSVMMTHDNKVYVCGDNSCGQLGFNKTINQSIGTPTRIDIADLLLQASQEEKPTLRMQMR